MIILVVRMIILVARMTTPHRTPWGPGGARGPKGPKGAQVAPRGPLGAQGAPWGPKGPKRAQGPPKEYPGAPWGPLGTPGGSGPGPGPRSLDQVHGPGPWALGPSCVAMQVSPVLPSRSLLCCQAGLSRVAKQVPRISPNPPGGSGGWSPPGFGGVRGAKPPRWGRRHSRHRPYSTVRHASDY